MIRAPAGEVVALQAPYLDSQLEPFDNPTRVPDHIIVSALTTPVRILYFPVFVACCMSV